MGTPQRPPIRRGLPCCTGRGIKICDRWSNFENFLADMGERPQGTTLDRTNNDLGYGPDNCCWRTPREQANNRRNSRKVTVGGQTHTIAEWSKITQLGYYTICYRLARGWSAEKAVFTAVGDHRRAA